MEEKQILICDRCNVELELKELTFSYLGEKMYYKVLRCPICGQVYIPESLVDEKIRKVEESLEEK